MRTLVLVLALVLASPAIADPFVLYGSYGELVDSPKWCGDDVRAELWRWFPGGFGLRIVVADGKARILPAPAPPASCPTCGRGVLKRILASDKLYTAEDGRIDAIWNLGKRSLVVSLFPERISLGRRMRTAQVSLVVEGDTIDRNKVSCYERWLGEVDLGGAR